VATLDGDGVVKACSVDKSQPLVLTRASIDIKRGRTLPRENRLGPLDLLGLLGETLAARAGLAGLLLVKGAGGDRGLLVLVVGPLEEEVRLLGALRPQPLDTGGGDGDEEDPEGDDDADVAPQVAVAVAECGLEVGVARDKGLADLAALDGAGKVVALAVRGDERAADAIKRRVVELVRHGRLESIVERVEPARPRQPRLHRALRDEVAGVCG